MTTLRETEVDGVRCFWVDTGRPTLAGSLVFRQGMADEPLVESGWLHMLEHLALHGRGGGALHVNGSVSLLRTSFDAHGPADAVASHFADLSKWLAQPQFDEFEREKGVLRAEAVGRGGIYSRSLSWRFGAHGPGVFNYDEPGIGRSTPEALAERSTQVFTKDNAVLVLDGPPPPGLTLGLADGIFLPPQRAVPCDDSLPACYVDEAGMVLSGLVPRSAEATILPELIQRMLREKLRDDAGAAYAPWSHYEAVDQDSAVIVAGSDINSELNYTVVRTLRSALKKIADFSVPRDHVAEAVESTIQTVSDPYSAIGVAYRAANAVQQGHEPESFEQIIDEIRSITAVSLHETVKAFTSTLLLGAPAEAKPQEQMTLLAPPGRGPRSIGRAFRHHNWPAEKSELVVGPEVLQIADTEAYRSMSYNDVEAMFAYEDGGRLLVAHDGWGMSVEPGEWKNGREAVALLDRTVALERHLLQPSRGQAMHTPRMSALSRWRTAFFANLYRPLVLATIIVLLLGIIGVLALAQLWIVAGFVAVFMVRFVWESFKGEHSSG